MNLLPLLAEGHIDLFEVGESAVVLTAAVLGTLHAAKKSAPKYKDKKGEHERKR